MLTASELVELFDAVASRASSDSERASIARLTEIVGSDPQKWVTALAAHALATAALARDADQALRERILDAGAALAQGVAQVVAEAEKSSRGAAAALRDAADCANTALSALNQAAAAATKDISESRSEAVSEAARSALASLGRVLPERLSAEASKLAALEVVRLGRATQIVAAIWGTIGVFLGLASPLVWRVLFR